MSMSNLTLEEVESDRVASAIDLELLQDVVEGIRGFISNGNRCGENRNFLKVDLLKWESMFAQASHLHERILAKHKTLTEIK